MKISWQTLVVYGLSLVAIVVLSIYVKVQVVAATAVVTGLANSLMPQLVGKDPK